jgi:hypothetical protein
MPGGSSSGIFYLLKIKAMKHLIQTIPLSCYTQTITCAYGKIINEAKHHIACLEEKPLRQVLERTNKGTTTPGIIIHEFLSPLIYLRLEHPVDGKFIIHYGYEQTECFTKYYPITSAFIRSIYRYTAKENTEINIESCVHTDWVITNCAELFEYIGDRNKYHTVSTIEFRDSKTQDEILQFAPSQ